MVVQFLKNLPYFSLGLFIFFLPIDFHMATLILSFFYISFYLQLDFKKIFNKIIFYLPFIIITAIYLYHYTISNDKSLGLNSMFLFSLVFLIIKINKEWLEKYLKVFIIGLIVLWVFCMIYPFLYKFNFSTFSFSPWSKSEITIRKFNFLNYFISQQFTKFSMDRAYFSMYFNLGIAILLNTNIFQNKYKFIIYFIFILAVIQSYSVMGAITLSSIFIFFIITKFFNYKFLNSIVISSIFIFLFGFLYFSVYNNGVNAVLPNDNTKKEVTRLDYRKFLWMNASHLSNEAGVLGQGTQKTQSNMDMLFKKNTKWSDYWIVNKFNAHNQYFQFILEIGWLGFIVYIIGILILVFSSINSQYHNLITFFVIIVLLTGFTESIFHRFVGIALIMFFYSLFLKQSLNESR